MIRPVMAYVNVVWSSCDKRCLNHVLKLQKRVARIILDADSQASSVKLFNKLKWIPFYEQAKIAKCCIIYKHLQGDVPTYLTSFLKLSCETHSWKTRYANFNLACPIVKRQKGGGRTFTVTTCKLWNSLPLTTHKLATLSSFKKLLWKNIFNNQQVLNHFIL